MRKLVSFRTIDTITPIPGADFIETASIGGWKVVVKKGDFFPGSLCVFFEIDSFLPVRPWSEFLLKRESLKDLIVDGMVLQGIRLHTIKLKKQISQGLALPLSAFPELDISAIKNGDETDLTEKLGVCLYEKPIPPQLAGEIKGKFPHFIPKTDEERIQNLPEYLKIFADKDFFITEKLDGTSVTFAKYDGENIVCSRNISLIENAQNLYWKMALLHLAKIPTNHAVQGEIIGLGVQGNPYLLNCNEFHAFNVFNISEQRYLTPDEFLEFCAIHDIPTVPIVHPKTKLSNWFDYDDHMESMLQGAQSISMLNPGVQREGVVFRAYLPGEKVSFKVVSNKYLLEEK